MTAVHWTRPERGHGPTGEHVATVGTRQARVRKARGPRASGWDWYVVDYMTDDDARAGNAPSWQAARRIAAAVLTA